MNGPHCIHPLKGIWIVSNLGFITNKAAKDIQIQGFV